MENDYAYKPQTLSGKMRDAVNWAQDPVLGRGPPVGHLDSMIARSDGLLKQLCDVRSMSQTVAERLLGPDAEPGEMIRHEKEPAPVGIVGEMGARLTRMAWEIDSLQRALNRIAKL